MDPTKPTAGPAKPVQYEYYAKPHVKAENLGTVILDCARIGWELQKIIYADRTQDFVVLFRQPVREEGSAD